MTHNDSVQNTCKLLVVDDEPIVHRMIERIVHASELPLDMVGAFSSGAEALAAAAELRPHICLLDIEMSEMNGLELARHLIDLLGYKPVVIYLTAHRSFDYAQEAVRVGAIDYLVKPIRRTDVLAAMGRAVGLVEAARLDQIEHQRLRGQLESVLPAALSSVGPAEQTRQASIAQAARVFIDEHYAEPLSLADVSADLNFSPGYLGALFKAEYGIPLKAYLKRVRIARAKELMHDPRLNLTEVALRVGYEDISYFSQCFLDETGVRPSEYRGGGRHWPK